jgi:hypothetical protein
MKSWQQVEVVKFNSLVETSKNTFKTTIVWFLTLEETIVLGF